MDNDLNELIKRVQKGDIESFGKIYDLLLDRIYRFVYFRVSSKEDAEDLTEQIFMKVWENLKGYDDIGLPLEAWVFKIARNQVIDYYRTRKTNIPIDEVLEIEDQSRSVEDIVESSLTNSAVAKTNSGTTDHGVTVSTVAKDHGVAVKAVAK